MTSGGSWVVVVIGATAALLGCRATNGGNPEEWNRGLRAPTPPAVAGGGGRPVLEDVVPGSEPLRTEDVLALVVSDLGQLGFRREMLRRDGRLPHLASEMTFAEGTDRCSVELSGPVDAEKVRPRYWVYAWNFPRSGMAERAVLAWLRGIDGLKTYQLGESVSGVKSPPKFVLVGSRRLLVVEGRCEDGGGLLARTAKVISGRARAWLGDVQYALEIACGGPLTAMRLDQ